MAIQQPSPQMWMGMPPSIAQPPVQLHSPTPVSSDLNPLRRSVTRKAIGQGASGLQTPRPKPASMAVAQPQPHQPALRQQYQPVPQQQYSYTPQQQPQQLHQPLPQQQSQHLRPEARASPSGLTPTLSHSSSTPSPTSQARGSVSSASSNISRASTAFSTPNTAVTTPVTSPLASPGGWPQVSQPQPQLHRSWTVPAGTIPASPTMTVKHDRAASSSGMVCSHCKAIIPINVSVYSCLVCSTAQMKTSFCVWCYTSGAAGSSHPHNKAYYVTDTDLRVQPPAAVPADVWTARRNIAGTVWYTHNATGVKTYIQPKPAAFPANSTGQLAPGWHERRTADGRSFWFNSGTGGSAWTKPVVAGLPAGWKEMRTPDLVPFYANEALGLSTWDRPGHQPKQAPAPVPTVAAVPSAKASKAVARSAGGSKTPGTKSVAAAAAGGAGLLSATGKMFGKLGKSKNLKMMSKLVSLADGDFAIFEDFGGEDEGEVEEEVEAEAETEEVACEEEPVAEGETAGSCQAPQDPYAYTGEQTAVAQEQQIQQPYPAQPQVYEQPPVMPQEQFAQPVYPPQPQMYEQPPAMPPQEQPVPAQQDYPPQPQMYEQPVTMPAEQAIQQAYPPQPLAYEQPPVMVQEQPVQEVYPPQGQFYEQPPAVPPEQQIQPVYPPQPSMYEQPVVMPDQQQQPVQQVYPQQPLAPEQPLVMAPEQMAQQNYPSQPSVCQQPVETYQQPFVYEPVLSAQQDSSQTTSVLVENTVTEPVVPPEPAVQPTTGGYVDTAAVQGFPPPLPVEPAQPVGIQPLDSQPPVDVPPPVHETVPPTQEVPPPVSNQPPPPEPVTEPFYDLTSMSGFPGGMEHMAGQNMSGPTPPFVFEPILAAEPMVSPPTQQNGVIYAPTYV